MSNWKRILQTVVIATTIGITSVPVTAQTSWDPNPNQLYSYPDNPLSCIVPEAVRQGKVGDCYFLAAVGSLAKLNPQAIKDMIKENGDGTFTVTFPGAPNEPITVSTPTEGELKEFAHGGYYGYWVPVLEKAYGTYCNKSVWRRDITSPFGSDTPNKGADGGSHLNAGLTIMTPGGRSTDSTTFSHYSTIVLHLEKALAEKRPVTLGTSCLPNKAGLPTQHEYSVLAFTPNWNNFKESMVTIYNPHGDGKANSGPNGSTSATFQMSLEVMCKTFDHVAYADKPVETKPDPSTVQSTGNSGTTAADASNTPPPPKPFVSNIQNDEGYTVLSKSMIKTQETTENGTRTTELKDGTTMVENRDGYRHFKWKDGREYERIPGVSETWIDADETKTIIYPDKTKVTMWKSGGKLTELPDGTKISELKSGTKITTKPDGTSTTERPNKSTAMNDSTSSQEIEGLVTSADHRKSSSMCDSSGSAKLLEEESNKGNIAVALRGDGETTSHITLVLTNLSSQEESVTVPKFECFIPSKQDMQIMMAIGQSQVLHIAPGATTTAQIASVCASTKSLPPPQTEAIAYQPSSYPDKNEGQVLQAILEASNTLNQNKSFNNAPVATQHRAETIAQLAIWTEMGSHSSNIADAITSAVLKEDLCKAAKIDTAQLKAQQNKQLDDAIANIMLDVNQTLKEARKLATAGTQNAA